MGTQVAEKKETDEDLDNVVSLEDQDHAMEPEDPDAVADEYVGDEPKDDDDAPAAAEKKEDAPKEGDSPPAEAAPKEGDSPKEEGLQVSDEIRSQAENLGFTEEDIKEYDNEADLMENINRMEKHIAKVGQNALDADKPPAQDPPPAAPPAATPAAPEKEDPPEEIKLDLPDDMDADVKKALGTAFAGIQAQSKRQLKEALGEVENLKTQLNGIQNESIDRKTIAFETQFESLVSGLGKEYKETLGEGSGRDLDQKLVPFQNRVKVIHEMHALETGYEKTGLKIPSINHLFKAAVRNVVGDKSKEQARADLNGKIVNRGKQISNRPTNRQPVGKTPEERAGDIVTKFWADKGVTIQDEIEEVF